MKLPTDVVSPHNDTAAAVREYLIDQGEISPVENLTELELSFGGDGPVQITHYVAEPMEGFV